MRHTHRSRLIWDEEKKVVAVQVMCETCGDSVAATVSLPLPLNELHRFVLAAKEKLSRSCF